MVSRRVGIAGAGLLGRLLAFELSQAGHRVDVFDPAAGPDRSHSLAAGWTAAGMLSPVAELECANEHVFALGLRSIELWPQIVARLGLPVQLVQKGSLLLAHRGDEGAAQRMLDLLHKKAPASHHPQALSRTQLHELEPAIQGSAHAWLLTQEGQIHTVQAMQALTAAGSAQGVQWHWQQRVHSLQPGELTLEDGSVRQFDWVIDTRGTGARPELPVRGVRGEIFTLHAPGVQLQRAVRLLHPRYRVYLVPRMGEHIVVGASEIESEDRSEISVRSTLELLSAAHSVLPALAEARIVHSEVNLRPALPDNLPQLTTQPGLTRINGLFRHGWLIAPALVTQCLQEQEAFASSH